MISWACLFVAVLLLILKHVFGVVGIGYWTLLPLAGFFVANCFAVLTERRLSRG